MVSRRDNIHVGGRRSRPLQCQRGAHNRAVGSVNESPCARRHSQTASLYRWGCVGLHRHRTRWRIQQRRIPRIVRQPCRYVGLEHRAVGRRESRRSHPQPIDRPLEIRRPCVSLAHRQQLSRRRQVRPSTELDQREVIATHSQRRSGRASHLDRDVPVPPRADLVPRAARDLAPRVGVELQPDRSEVEADVHRHSRVRQVRHLHQAQVRRDAVTPPGDHGREPRGQVEVAQRLERHLVDRLVPELLQRPIDVERTPALGGLPAWIPRAGEVLDLLDGCEMRTPEALVSLVDDSEIQPEARKRVTATTEHRPVERGQR